MKNVSIFLTLGILLISAAVLTSLPRNAVAQAYECNRLHDDRGRNKDKNNRF